MRTSLISLMLAAGLCSAGLAQAEVANYVPDQAHTHVTFEIGHFGTSTNRGRFDKTEGTVQLDRVAKTGKVDISIDVRSIDTGFAPFNTHLQSADLFDAAKYPSIRFASDLFVFKGDQVSEIHGDLTLLGKTQPVVLKATNFNCYVSPMTKKDVCGGDFETTVDRSAFGMNYGLDWGFPKTARVVVQIEAVKQ